MNVQWEKESLQQMVLGRLDSLMQKNETGPFSYTIRKDKLKVDERPKCLARIGHNNFFQDMSLKARETEAKMNFWDFIKIRTFAQQRKQSTKLKGNPQNGRRYLQMTLQRNGWYPRSIKNFSNSRQEKQIMKSKNNQKGEGSMRNYGP